MLTTDLRRDYIRTWLARTDQLDMERLESAFTELEDLAAAEHAEDMGYKVRKDRLPTFGSTLHFEREADLRYRGQEHTVQIPIPSGTMTAHLLREVESRFHKAHKRQYSFQLSSPVELVNLHVLAFGLVHKPGRHRLKPSTVTPSPRGSRSVWLEEEGRVTTPVYRRSDLRPGDELEGPALVEELASVTLLYSEMRLTVEPSGELVLHTGI
jgi:N-methylhydantoinase A